MEEEEEKTMLEEKKCKKKNKKINYLKWKRVRTARKGEDRRKGEDEENQKNGMG